MKKLPQFDFYKNRKTYFLISGAIFAVALIVALIFGVKADIKFTGGTMTTYSYTGSVSSDEFKNVVAGDGIGKIGEILKNFAIQGGGVATLEPHLVSFVGLNALEKDGKTDKNVGAISFKNDREAFDVDVKAVRNIMSSYDVEEDI